MRALMPRALAALLPPLLLAACDPAGTDLGFGAETTGEVAVGLFLDRDGSGTASAPDTVYAGAVVRLRPLAGGAPVATATSDAQGLVRFESLPLGDYRVTVDAASLGDSLSVAAIDRDSVRISAAAPQAAASVRLAWEESAIREARTRPPGTRVFVRGVVSSGVQVFSDQSMHLSDTSRAIRVTGVTLLGGLTGSNPGDSVVVRGILGLANGQPVFTAARVLRVATRPAPIPAAITSGAAATAQNGALDAAFVNLTSVTVSDTSTVAPDFRVVASDGSGAVTIILDANIPFARTQFRPGRTMNIRGVLVPTGQGTWVLKPRFTGDVTFLN